MANSLPHIAEYGSELFRNHKATVTILRTETRRKDRGVDVPAEYRYENPREWALTHVTAGYVIAGSAARYQDREIWKVTTRIDNATAGMSFLTLPEAEAWLDERGEKQ